MPNPDESKNYDVFVSYSSQDKVIADAVVAAHEQAGIRCWYAPRDIAPAADWADSITKAIQDCSLMVLVFSETANRSQRVLDEINFAIDQGKPILPFRIEPYNPTGALSLHLSSRHWLDAYEPCWDVFLDQLVESVSSNLSTESKKPKARDTERGSVKRPSQKPKPFIRTVIPVLVGLVLVSVVGYFGWKWLAGDDTPTPTEVAIIPSDTPIATSTQEEAAALPDPTPTPGYTGVLNSALVESEPITSLDPLVADGEALIITKHLFLGLVRFNPETTEVEGAAAGSWTISPDGTIYTFTLHPDIPWVQHTMGGETVQVLDEDGTPRFLTAADFVFSFKQICDPRVEASFPELLSNVVGCSETLNYSESEAVPPQLFDEIAIEAVSQTELIIRLVEPSASFITKMTYPTLVALPSWAMEKYGDAWTNPGLIHTNGIYVIDDWISGEKVDLLRNPLQIEALQGEGNLGKVELTVVDDYLSAYQLWLNSQLDFAEVPVENLSEHLDKYPDQTREFATQLVFFAYLNLQREPFDNTYVRMAFSAALDRVLLLEKVLGIGGTPMFHLAPPGVFGAPPIDEVGQGYDPEKALELLTEAGFPGCAGLPQVSFYSYSNSVDPKGAELAMMWEDALGCDRGTIAYRGSLAGIMDDPDQWSDWDMIITGWGSDYPDQEDWITTHLSCDSNYPFSVARECDSVDLLLERASVEITPSERKNLYIQAEEEFFGEGGSFPIIPLYSPTRFFAVTEWVDFSTSLHGEGTDFFNATIDMELKGESGLE